MEDFMGFKFNNYLTYINNNKFFDLCTSVNQ